MSSKQPEALRLAELMDYLSNDSYDWWQEFDKCAAELRRLYAEVDSLSYRLAYPDNFVKEPEQEPVYLVWLRAYCAWMHTDKESFDKISDDERWMLYTSPPARKPLTDEELFKLWLRVPAETEDRFAFARAIEAAHGIGEKK